MSQKQVRPHREEKPAKPEIRETSPSTPPKDRDATTVAVPKGKTKEALNKLLDEVDDILEENAEEFVRSYVQRGGE